MDANALDLIRSQATEQALSAGTALLHERSDCSTLYLLVEGWACRYATTADGSRQILAILVPGDFCNLDILGVRRSDYGIRAITSARFAGIKRTRAIELAQSSADVMQLFLSRMAIENAMLGRWTLCLGRKTALARLAHLLCELAVRLQGVRTGDGARFTLPLTQEQIGDVLGLTTVHVNRTLRELRSLDLIEKLGNTMEIPSIARLADAAEFDESYLHRSDLSGPLFRNGHASATGTHYTAGEPFS